MIPVFSGLSLTVHLIVILLAKLFNFVFVMDQSDMFASSRASSLYKRGSFASRTISLTIFICIVTYLAVAGGFVVSTSIRVGRDEPQVVFFKQAVSVAVPLVVDSLLVFDLFAAEENVMPLTISYAIPYEPDIQNYSFMVMSCELL